MILATRGPTEVLAGRPSLDADLPVMRGRAAGARGLPRARYGTPPPARGTVVPARAVRRTRVRGLAAETTSRVPRVSV